MKSLLVTLEYPPFKGGVGVYLSALSNQFDQNSIVVLAQSTKNSFLFDKKQNHTIYREQLLGKIWPRWFKTISLVKKYIKQEKIDHVIISHILPIGYIFLFLNIPFTVILHGMDIRLATINPIKAFLTKILLNKAQYIIANSQFTKNEVEKIGISKDVIIAYPCTDTTLESTDPTLVSMIKHEYKLDNCFVVLSVNRLVARKGNDTTIKAIKRLVDSGITNIKYVIIGNGEYKEKLNKLIVQLNLEEFVVILSGIDDEQKDAWYEICDVFSMPSRVENQYDVEGFGIVFLEAGLHKKPSIAGNTGGMPEAVIDGETGFIVNSLDESDVADAIHALYTNQDLKVEMGSAAYDRTLKLFTWEKQFKKYITKLQINEN